MSDLPVQELFQQMHANTHSGEHLEVLGKKAAADWGDGQFRTLTEAVVTTVKHAHLSPEQVKRVVEFANTAAYLTEFKKEGAPHHVVEFSGGPADVSDILKDLNDGGGGTVFDGGAGDYHMPPNHREKTASNEGDSLLAELFDKTAGDALPYANPHGEVIELKDKLASTAEHIQSTISGLEVAYAEPADRLYHQVKQGSLSGLSLGDVMTAWDTVAPSPEYIKAAFALMTPRLLREGVFADVDTMMGSVDKIASNRMVNPEHALVVDFSEFCETLGKLAELRDNAQELRGHIRELDAYLKTAGGAVVEGYKSVGKALSHAGEKVAPYVEKAFGEQAGKATKGVLSNAHHVAALLAGSEALTHLQHGQSLPARAARGAADVVTRNIPGTPSNYRHKYEVESGQ